jgi:hypothetical protein
MRLLLCCLLALAFIPAHAERIGDFEINVFTQNQESNSQTLARGGSWTATEKEQKLFYRVRIEYKGLKKLENAKVDYIVQCYSPQRDGELKPGANALRGSYEIKELSPLSKVEFDTDGFDKNYLKAQWGGGKQERGKAELKGITFRILQGEGKLAEYSSPAEMQKMWEEVDKQSEERKRPRNERSQRRNRS